MAELLDLGEDALHPVQLVAEFADLDAEPGELEFGVFLCRDRHVAEATVFVGEAAVCPVGGQGSPRLPEALRWRTVTHVATTIATASDTNMVERTGGVIAVAPFQVRRPR